MKCMQKLSARFTALTAAVVVASGIGCDRVAPRPSEVAGDGPASNSVREMPAPPKPPTFPVRQQPEANKRGQRRESPRPQPPAKNTPVPLTGATGTSAAAAPSRQGAPNPNHASPAVGGTSRSGPRTQFYARLSAGVALPQSLPNGTTMGFSVDYVLSRNLPGSGNRSIWVIQSAKGGSVAIPVQLKAKGNLSAFAPGLRPEHGPFQSYLAIQMPDGRQQVIAPKVAMKSY